MSNPSSEDTVVDILTTVGTAGTADYTEVTTTVTIPAGDTSVDVTVPTTEDTIDEIDEDFTVDGTVTSGNTANTDPSGTVTILDDDDAPTITISDVDVTEGDDAVVTVELSNPSSEDIVVDIVTTVGTAGSDDYTEVTTTVTIPAGDTSVDVTVPTTEDDIDEADEDFTVCLLYTSDAADD